MSESVDRRLMPSTPLDDPVLDMLLYEEEARSQGFQLVAGIDEVGRGPLAGPVVAAAVILPCNPLLHGVRDSKKLSPSARECRYKEILSCSTHVGLGLVEAAEIDRINILQATFRAMVKAVEELGVSPDLLLIDGPYTLPLNIPQKGIPQGDQKSLSIAAASIVAKVHRDRLMSEYHKLYPEYGFNENKGYGSRRHMEAIRLHGPCPLHRKSFRGVVE